MTSHDINRKLTDTLIRSESDNNSVTNNSSKLNLIQMTAMIINVEIIDIDKIVHINVKEY